MSQSRIDQIIRLLETRDDNLPGIRNAQIRGAKRGFIHKTIAAESCPDCLANHKTMFGCETCHGRGRIESFRERDPYALEKVQPYGFTPDRAEARRARDSELSRLALQLAPPMTEADALASTPPHPWEIKRRRMYREYDYAALDHALTDLRLDDEAAYHIIHGVYIYGTSEPNAVIETIVQRGLRYVDHLMPDPIRAPGDVIHPALERRATRTAA